MQGQRKRAVAYWLLGYALFIVIASANMPSPLYETYRSVWNLSATTITLIFSAYAIV